MAYPTLNLSWRRLRNRLHARRSLWRAEKDPRSPILVYQMGKVGSTSLTHALKTSVERPIFKVHRLNPIRIRKVVGRLQAEHREVPWDLRFGGQIYRRLIAPGRHCQIISLVRDPIERNISGYFEFLDNRYRTRDAHAKQPLAKLLEDFLSNYNQNFALDWFDLEMKAVFGLDVYQTRFPIEKRSLELENERCRLLLLRADLPETEKSDAVSEFLQRPVQVERRHNISRQKAYGALYEKFCAEVKFPRALVETTLASRLVTHFYSVSEREQMLARWVSETELYKE